MSNAFFTVTGAAAQIGISPSTLKNWEARRLVTAVRDSSGRRLFTEESIRKAKSYKQSLVKSKA